MMKTDQIQVLDKGFVRLVDTMGDDAAIVQAARVSYGAGTTTVSDDRTLIRYLMRNRHTTPFEMCEAKFHVRVPMDVWRQWIRHRTASVSEYSTRYSLAIEDKLSTHPDMWRRQAEDNKQGSSGRLNRETGQVLSEREHDLHSHAELVYRERLEAGVAREQARKDLPLATYTEAYWKIDLHNLFHFLDLRLDPHAQQEIRAYATVMSLIVAQWVPLAWEAFCDYRRDAVVFSRLEMDALRRSGGLDGLEEAPFGMSAREMREFKRKLGL